MPLNIKKEAFQKLMEQNETSEKTHTILIVDDEIHNLTALKKILEIHYKVLTAMDGQAALDLVKSMETPEDIHLIISDQRMNRMTGVEFLEQTVPIIPRTIRIILTGYTDINATIDSINKGQIYKFLTKPIDPGDFEITVKRALEVFELEEKNRNLISDLKAWNASLEHKVQEKTEEIQEDLKLAQKFQQAMLPEFPEVPYLKFAFRYVPYSGVSGDTYDVVVRSDGGVNLFLGDATGHGISAAFMTMMAQIGIDSLPDEITPNEALGRLNKLLTLRDHETKYISGVFAQINAEGELLVAHAGHPPLIIIPKNESPYELAPVGGPPLGVFYPELEPYKAERYQLTPGDRVFCYTDGIVEWLNKESEIFGYKRLLQCLEKYQSVELDKLLSLVIEEVEQFAQGHLCDDDVTLIGFEYTQ